MSFETIKPVYIKDFHGIQNLYADIQFKKFTDEEESQVIVNRVFIRHQFSMGAGHSEDITSLFISHESVMEELQEYLVKLCEENTLKSDIHRSSW